MSSGMIAEVQYGSVRRRVPRLCGLISRRSLARRTDRSVSDSNRPERANADEAAPAPDGTRGPLSHGLLLNQFHNDKRFNGPFAEAVASAPYCPPTEMRARTGRGSCHYTRPSPGFRHTVTCEDYHGRCQSWA